MSDRLAQAAEAVLLHWRNRDHIDPEDGFVLDELAIALKADDRQEAHEAYAYADGVMAAAEEAKKRADMAVAYLRRVVPLMGRDGWLTEADEALQVEILRDIGLDEWSR